MLKSYRLRGLMVAGLLGVGIVSCDNPTPTPAPAPTRSGGIASPTSGLGGPSASVTGVATAVATDGPRQPTVAPSPTAPPVLRATPSPTRALTAIRVVAPAGAAPSRFALLDAATGLRVHQPDWAGSVGDVVAVPPGTYRVYLERAGVTAPVAVPAGETTAVTIGALRVTGPASPQRPRIALLDPMTDQRVHLNEWAGEVGNPVAVAPGSYRLQVEDGGTTASLTVAPGQTLTVFLGILEVRGRDPTVRVALLDPATRQRMHLFDWATQVGNRHYVVPGTYTVQVENGRTFENVTIKEGEATVLRTDER